MIFIDTWNMQFRLDLLDGATMIMPGEQATIRITLPSDMPIFVGQNYTLRENNMTVATGIVTKLCTSLKVIEKSRLNKLDIKI
jgi:elongation factor Tu